MSRSATLLFAGLGLELWVAPEQAAHRLGLEVIRAGGVATVRADVGGLFVGMAIVCGVAAWTRRRSWIFAAIFLLGAIVFGRSIGWIANRGVGDDLFELIVELTVIVALLAAARGARPAAPIDGC